MRHLGANASGRPAAEGRFLLAGRGAQLGEQNAERRSGRSRPHRVRLGTRHRAQHRARGTETGGRLDKGPVIRGPSQPAAQNLYLPPSSFPARKQKSSSAGEF